MKSKSGILYTIIGLALMIGGFYFYRTKSMQAPATPTKPETTQTTTSQSYKGVQYKNTQYGFRFELPDSWKGFTVIEDDWEGDQLKAGVQVGVINGPMVTIRHPDWDYKAPRQDIPIFIFTIAQWDSLLKDEFHIGAAPIQPSELGRNSKYVFALPARYNFSFLTGYEEVEMILAKNPLKPF